MSVAPQDTAREEFTAGICATGGSSDLLGLTRRVLAEGSTGPLRMRRLVVVASACPGKLVSELRRVGAEDRRLELVVEDRRHGKAEALNKVLARVDTPYVVFVNSDASPERGAIGSLLSVASTDQRVGAVSAQPVTEGGRGMASLLVDLMWSAHNLSSVALNHMDVSNHSCDELVLFRSSAISKLPADLVNDGAFLAATARLRGYSVKVCQSAKVRIKTPKRISEIVLQRRRILFGHAQVWRKTGTPPKTIESLLFLSPLQGIRLMVGTLAAKPRLLLALPMAFASETSAALLSILDTARRSNAHAVWRRFN